MITELEIQNFRGLRNVKMTGLRRANLIVGGNDTGKTRVLEALVLLFGDGTALRNLPITFRTNQSGGQSADDNNDRENFWSWLFYDRNPANSISIQARLNPQGMITVETGQSPDPHLRDSKDQPVLTRTDSRAKDDGTVRRPGMPKKGETQLVQFGQQ